MRSVRLRYCFGGPIFCISTALLLLLPFAARATEAYEQEFTLTAYYSPEPDQCGYVTGGLTADKILNGEGHTTADGSAVAAGMIAAPPSYAFGTRVALPGLGTFTVRDRGGAIQELGSGNHRLDVWVGGGEEGLARALAFGVQHMRGTVYPPGTDQPAEVFDLASLPAPPERLETYCRDRNSIAALRADAGDTSFSVRLLQESLKNLGYFRHGITGFFGSTTSAALTSFIGDFGVDSAADGLTERTAAFLAAAIRRVGARSPVSGYVDAGSSKKHVAQAQRTLRFLGYYRGRTDGVHTQTLADAVLKFQLEQGIVQSAEEAGAGRIGPATLRILSREWNRRLVAKQAEHELVVRRIDTLLAQRGAYVDRFLAEGNNGAQVRLLQTLLADRGFFPREEINGNYGPLTQASVLAYQLDREIVEGAHEAGAGAVGPQTLAALQNEVRLATYRLVRAQGWGVL